jgi:hypothetical protein
MLHDVLKKENQITEECRDELKFELLQRVCSILFASFVMIKKMNLFRVKVSILIHH